MGAETEYLQIQPGHNSEISIRQADEETTPSQVQANQAKTSKIELLFQALQRLTAELVELKDTHKATVMEKAKKRSAGSVETKGFSKETAKPLLRRETSRARRS